VECTGGRAKKLKWIKPFALRGAWVRTNFILVHVVPGVTAVFVSVFGYFLSMITAFSAIAALLIWLCGQLCYAVCCPVAEPRCLSALLHRVAAGPPQLVSPSYG